MEQAFPSFCEQAKLVDSLDSFYEWQAVETFV